MGGFDKLFGGAHLNVESPKSQTIAASDQLMDEDQFWNIIQDCKAGSDGDYDQQQVLLERALRQLAPEEIILFANRFKHLRGQANTWELRGAIHIIQTGCSDDGFYDFREWVIAQGKDFYYKTTENPETLMEVEADQIVGVDLDGLGYVPEISFQDLTGQKMPSTYEENLQTTGRPWSAIGDDLERLFPRLCSRYLQTS